MTAARYTLVLTPFDARRLARGKGKKGALVAVARKVLVLMVTLLADERDGDPDWATRPLWLTG